MESGETVQLQTDDLIQIGPWKFLVRLKGETEDLDQAMVQEIDKVPPQNDGDEVPTLVRTDQWSVRDKHGFTSAIKI